MLDPNHPPGAPRAPVITVDESPGLVTVRLTGEFDMANVAEVEDVLERMSGHNHVNIDLTSCDFLDSSILRVLLRASSDARTRDRWLSVTVPPRARSSIASSRSRARSSCWTSRSRPSSSSSR